MTCIRRVLDRTRSHLLLLASNTPWPALQPAIGVGTGERSGQPHTMGRRDGWRSAVAHFGALAT